MYSASCGVKLQGQFERFAAFRCSGAVRDSYRNRRVAFFATVNCVLVGWWCGFGLHSIRRMKSVWRLIVDRLKAAWAALHPDAEASAVLRRALNELAPLKGRRSWWERLLRGTGWAAAIALVGWIALVLFPR